MRSQRAFFYAVGWAVLTVLAAFAVWWGLRPLLSSTFRAPVPIDAFPFANSGFRPGSAGLAAARRARRVPAPKPKPSMYDGWAYSNGGFHPYVRA